MKKYLALSLLAIIVMLPISSPAAVGYGENNLIKEEWNLDLNIVYGWGLFGVTPAIANLPGVNAYGGEPNADLEIITGSDGYMSHLNPTSNALGLWRAIDSRGNIEWYKDTQSDESRGSVAVSDLNGDGYPEIVGGTTSGHTLEVMDRFGDFVWTFPAPAGSGDFEWPTAPAVADLLPSVTGLEIVAVHRPTCAIFAFDGDNRDAVNDGIVFNGLGNYSWTGAEGRDWDVLWTYRMPGNDCNGSAAIADIDHDGTLEVVAGSSAGNLYIVDGSTGALEQVVSLGPVQASPAVGNVDGDPLLEIVIGTLEGMIYVISWDGASAIIKTTNDTGSPIYSSASIGDIDKDGSMEIATATIAGNIYAFDSTLNTKWVYPEAGRAGAFYASPSFANLTRVRPYGVEWPMFRHDARRTGFYGTAADQLAVVIGSQDSYLYLIDGSTGELIDRFQSSGPIYGSPTIGDTDGDGKLNIIFQSWGEWGGFTQYDRLWNVEEVRQTAPVAIDIKPGSCPNPINISSKGMVTVAVAGTPDFDVKKIDLMTIGLAGVPPVTARLDDVTTPYYNDGSLAASGCSTTGPDGIADLVLKFETEKVAQAIGDVADDEVILLSVVGRLLPQYGGIVINGTDVVVINKSHRKDAAPTPTSLRHNLGVTDCEVSAVSGNIIAISMEESGDRKDYNNDGDTRDRVLGYYDISAKRLVNTGLSINRDVAIDGDTIVFELADTETLAYYSISTGAVTDTGVAVSGGTWGGTQGPSRIVSGKNIVYTVQKQDFNGDGYNDPEICVYDMRRGVSTCKDLPGSNPSISGNTVAFQQSQGGWWNSKVGYFNISTWEVKTTGVNGGRPIIDKGIIAFESGEGVGYYDISARSYVETALKDAYSVSLSNGVISALVNERDWNSDLNGDGDTDDSSMVVAYDIRSGAVINTTIQGCCGTDISAGVIVFDTYEGDIDTDLNGDGDTSDCVQQFVVLSEVPANKGSGDNRKGDTAEQWATTAVASSEYDPNSWAAWQATGEPDTFQCGDIVTAWAPLGNGPAPEWIELGFRTPVRATGLRVHETFETGFIYQVDLIDTSGEYHTVWTGSDTTGCPGWFEISFPKTHYRVQGVKLYTQTDGWEEVDAVALVSRW